MSMLIPEHFQKTILKSSRASKILAVHPVQELWSGYGQILRYELADSPHATVVVKYVHFPSRKKHPRGWNNNLSHKRKLKSYQVEMHWYLKWNAQCSLDCRTAKCLGQANLEEEAVLVLEDLDAVGFNQRRTSVQWPEVAACLRWLASLHARFLNKKPNKLWKVGCYWHLDTRPDELHALEDKLLKKAAPAIDLMLKKARYQTIVHGDAKLANFCFTPDGTQVAGVDFQYVGGGCGMKDVAYFIGSCFSEEECAAYETQILDCYFEYLKESLSPDVDAGALEEEWRSLYHVAWADFHRFLKGWSPGHWKINSYSERVVQGVLDRL